VRCWRTTAFAPPISASPESLVPNRIQALLGIEYPIVQAPMTYIARAELAAAVSEAGGLGVIETLTPQG
jgi:enoyl-[acyl-carrier protein] reductase II